MRHLVSKIRCREIEEDTPRVNSGLHAHMHVSTHMHYINTQKKKGKKKGGREGERKERKERKRGKEHFKCVCILVDQVDRETLR